MPNGVICGGAVEGSNQLGEIVTCQAIVTLPDGAATAAVEAIVPRAMDATSRRRTWNEAMRTFRAAKRVAQRERTRASYRPTATFGLVVSRPMPGGCISSRVRLGRLRVRPLGGFLGRHALDRLGVHVDDDVLADHLGRLAVGRPGIA